ncbi:glutathione hydrolase 6 [Alosa sapidissima]|uniref:glutathione hydrolase 6 n=1 Tax=Alosa sapidissima TaxID=34773 RepID=UPI001C08FDCC|nr:glutathione hydrolase 6 [Alosa sapidissima]
MFDAVRYEKLPSDITEETKWGKQESDGEEEGGEAVVHLLSVPGRQRGSCRGKRETCLRITATLVLLAVVLGFVLCEWSGCGAEEQGSGETQTTHADKGSEGHRHHHHHHHGDDDDDNDDDDDDDDHDHDHEEHSDHHSHTGSLFHHAAIITSSATCSRAGRKLLQNGGNIVDAGIAALLCLGVVHPHSAGIGGTFSAIFYNHTTKSLKAIQPSSPKNNITTYGIPAILPGIKYFHAQYGNLEWARLFEDAIRLGRDGFQIDHILASALLTNESRIVQSKLCILFCDESGRVKSAGSNVTNRNLSELLRSVSLNDSYFPEMLAMKLARDLSPAERPDFVRDVLRVTGEINGPLIAKEEKYTLLASSPPFSGSVLSDALERATELIHSLHNRTDLNSSVPSLISLLKLAKEIYNTSQAEENGSPAERLALSVASSQIGVLHSQGHFLIISASLNSPWGSGRYLPSGGFILSDFVSKMGAGVPLLNFPLIIKIKNMDDDSDDDDDVQIIAVTGGLSALLNAGQILNRLDRGISSQEAVQDPLLHFAQGSTEGSVTVCVSSMSNGTDTVSILSHEEDGGGQPTDRCTDEDSTAMLLQLHAEHVRAYGAPAVKTHTDGF